MIRLYKNTDLKEIVDIWYNSIIDAHDFIDKNYWTEAKEIIVDKYLIESDTYVFEEKGIIKGFISVITMDSIWGLFVDHKYRRNGIADGLIKHVQGLYDVLSVSVYKKNEEALWVFKQNNFCYEHTQVDMNTKEEELFLVWRSIGDQS